jgi:hypothetical protein
MLLNHNKNPPNNYSFQNEVIGTYFSHLNFILNKKNTLFIENLIPMSNQMQQVW